MKPERKTEEELIFADRRNALKKQKRAKGWNVP